MSLNRIFLEFLKKQILSKTKLFKIIDEYTKVDIHLLRRKPQDEKEM